jgi:hypothetical protein
MCFYAFPQSHTFLHYHPSITKNLRREGNGHNSNSTLADPILVAIYLTNMLINCPLISCLAHKQHWCYHPTLKRYILYKRSYDYWYATYRGITWKSRNFKRSCFKNCTSMETGDSKTVHCQILFTKVGTVLLWTKYQSHFSKCRDCNRFSTWILQRIIL